MKKQSGLLGAFLFVVASLFGLAPDVFAQGSTYNLLGFGEPVPTASPALEGLGGAGVALGETRLLNDLNPAEWTFLIRARFETSLRYDYVSGSLGSESGAEHNYHYSGFSFGAPVWSKYHGAISLGFRPLTDASSETQVIDSVSSQTLRYQGGVNAGFLGVAFRPVEGIAFGARVDLLLGSVTHLVHLDFNDGITQSSEFERDYAMQGVRGTFGLDLIGDSIAESLHGLTLGLSYSMPTNLTVTKRSVITPLSSSLDTTLDVPGFGRYPASLTAGLSVRFGNRYRGEVDFGLQDFSSAFLYATRSDSSDALLGTSTRLAFGVERLPNMANEFGYSGFWDRLGLRFGVHYYALPFRPQGSGGVNELAASLGLGVPVNYESILNFALTAGQRTPVNVGSAPREFFIRLGAGVSLSERWFVPSRTDE